MKKHIALSIITTLSLTTLNAYEFKPVGFKAVGMGGTGVASTRGSLSSYYNPALLRFSDHTSEFSLNMGIRMRESNLMDPLDKLNELDFDGTLDRIAKKTPVGNKDINADGDTDDIGEAGTNNTDEDRHTISQAQDILRQIGTNNAFNMSVTPSFTAQMSDAFAIGIFASADINLRLNIDPHYTDLIFKDENTGKYYQYSPIDESNPSDDKYTLYADDAQGKKAYETSSLDYAQNNGINYIQVNTMVLGEVPISYAKAFDWKSGTWSFGGNIKPMTLITTSQKVNLGSSSDDADDDKDQYETTYDPTIGLDLGVAYRPTNSKMTIGLVGKNINSPTFKVDTTATGASDYTIDPMFRAGISMPILNDNIEFALDIDLTKNKTLIEGEDSQMAGVGIELHPASWFALRLGAMQDMASKKFDDGTIMTAGVGFGLKWLQVDLSAMMSTNTGQYDGNDIPRYAAVNFSIISKWGDGYNHKKPPVEDEVQQESQDTQLAEQEKARIQKESDLAQEELNASQEEFDKIFQE